MSSEMSSQRKPAHYKAFVEMRAQFEADPANRAKIVNWDRVERNLERFVTDPTDPEKIREGIAEAIEAFAFDAPPRDNSSILQGYGPARRPARW
jgi:hypothetical protein